MAIHQYSISVRRSEDYNFDLALGNGMGSLPWHDAATIFAHSPAVALSKYVTRPGQRVDLDKYQIAEIRIVRED